MALSRPQKEAVVAQLGDLLKNSKMTVFATYKGLSVNDMQDLRKAASENNTTVRVIKNRLFKLAASQNSALKGVQLEACRSTSLHF